VGTGKGGRLILKEVQLEGGKRMSSHDFALGHQVKKGDMLGR